VQIKDQELRRSLAQLRQALETACGSLDLPAVMGEEQPVQVANVPVCIS
jgi:hypothetical protein